MAETLAEKLKRLAREKAAAKAAAESQTVAEVTEVANVQPVETSKTEEVSDDTVTLSEMRAVGGETAHQADVRESSTTGDSKTAQEPIPSETVDSHPATSDSGAESSSLPIPVASNHPLSMQFLELEQALDSTDPSFKTKLRDIHRHLGTDPDLVTQMTEAEIALVVKGLVVFANAEIVEPAKAKSVKAATAAAKKKVISADDL